MLLLRTLGHLSLEESGAPLNGAAAQPSRLLLLAILAAAGEAGLSREKVLALFWPESDSQRARGALKQALYALRQATGHGDLVVGTTVLRLNLAVMETDVSAFSDAVRRGNHEQAVALYRGPFLDGASIRSQVDLERAVESTREVLARSFRRSLRELALSAESGGDHAAALMWWRRLAAEEPLSSSVMASLMNALSRTGETAEALRVFQRHEARVREELEVAPEPALTDLASRLRRDLGRSPDEVGSQGSSDAVHGAGITPESSAAEPTDIGAPESMGEVRENGARRWRSVRVAASLAFAVLAVAAFVFSSSAEPDAGRVLLVTPAGASLVERAVSEGIARRLSNEAIARPVSSPDRTGGWQPFDRHPALTVTVRQSAIAGDTTTTVTVDSGTTRSVLWIGSATEASNGAIDSLADRATAAIASRLDPWMSGWIGLSSEPASVASYRRLQRAIRLFTSSDYEGAQRSFSEAQELDPGLTIGSVFGFLSAKYGGGGDSATIAWLLRLREGELRPLDQALADYLEAVEARDLERAYERAQYVAELVPGSEWEWFLAKSAVDIGRPAEAVLVLDRIGPSRGWVADWQPYWAMLMRSLHYAGDYDGELAASREALRRFPASRISEQGTVKALSALGRVTEVDRVLDRALTKRTTAPSGQPMAQAVIELWGHGHLVAARHVADRTIDWIRQLPPGAERAELERLIPGLLYQSGRAHEARALAEQDYADHPGDLEAMELAGFVAAELGDTTAARRVERAAAAMCNSAPCPPELLITRAGIASGLGDREGAVGLLRDAVRMGWAWRSAAHFMREFDGLRGYAPFEELIRPISDAAPP